MALDTRDNTDGGSDSIRASDVLPVEQNYGGGANTARMANGAPLKTAVNARQGVISGRVITVLVISLTLAIVAMVLAWYFYK